MKITNTTKGDLGLDFNTIVPAGGSVEISNDALTTFKAIPVVKGWFVSGMLVESGAVEGKLAQPPKPAPVKKQRKGKKT